MNLQPAQTFTSGEYSSDCTRLIMQFHAQFNTVLDQNYYASLYSLQDVGVTQAPLGQNRGSKTFPYAVTKDIDSNVLSISAMPCYASKSHEELRWEDCGPKSEGDQLISISAIPLCGGKSHEELRWEHYVLDSRGQHDSGIQKANGNGICSTVNKHLPDFSSSITGSWGTQSPSFTSSTGPISSVFSPQVPMFVPTAPLVNRTSSPFLTPLLTSPASSLNSTPSITTTPGFTKSSSPFERPSFASPAPHSSFFPPSTTTLTYTQPMPLFQTPSIPSPAPSINLTPSSIITPAFTQTSMKPGQFSTSDSSVKPVTPWLTIVGIEKSQTSPALSTFVAPNLTGNNGGTSLDFSQPTLQQQFSSVGKVNNCIVAVRDPFGSLPATAQPSMGYSTSSLIQNGISSMPVTDKPATSRISSLLTSRHVSLRPLTVHVRKYQLRSDEPKVPFFDHSDETQRTCKTCTSIIPRENPRSVFGGTTELSQVKRTKEEASPLIDVFTVPLEDGKKDRNSSCISGCPASCFVEVNEDTKQSQKSFDGNCVQLKASPPKLQRSDYYTQPSILELTSVEGSEPGFCSHVKDFVVGRYGYGWVKFDGETDVRGLDLDALVHFNEREVIVYLNENEKPAVGEGLNKAAEVTLLNIKCIDKTGKQYSGKMVDKYIEKLKKVTEGQGAEFVSYDAFKGAWKFHVKHFSRYRISDEIWLEDEYHVLST